MKTNSPNPVLVVGLYRSGTSLLYSLLNQHPQIALMYECDVWDFPKRLAARRFRGDWLERHEFFGESLSRHGLIPAGRSGRLRGLEKVRTPEDLYRTFGEGKDAALWGEKSPTYCPRLLQLARRHPGCSIILIWRDPVEVYRSVVNAGRKEPIFRKPGMLSRIIYFQEQMICQAGQLGAAGARVHHVSYDQLINHTEEICLGLCEFLGVEFTPKMIDLKNGDFSSIYVAPHHEYLRRGVIQRQEYPEELLAPAEIHKLRRFRARWQRLRQGWPGAEQKGPEVAEPGLLERTYHNALGALLFGAHNVKRALFEFLPIPWLQTYREVKEWFFPHPLETVPPQPALWPEVARHRTTILTGAGVLSGVALLHSIANPHMVFVPFYAIPCAFLTLNVSRRWGTIAAVTSAVIGPVIQLSGDPDYAPYGVLTWNCFMRFLVFQLIVLLLDRVRREAHSENRSHG